MNPKYDAVSVRLSPHTFLKMEGCGNNFVVLEDLEERRNDWQSISAKILSSHFGMGGDGLMVLRHSKARDFEVLMYNPDGSLMGMCGNGIRCAARFLALKELIPPSKKEVAFVVEGRDIFCSLLGDGSEVQVDMGEPSFSPERVPLAAAQEFVEGRFEAGRSEYTATVLSMGNPHCVIFVPDLGGVDHRTVGPLIEHHPLFPKRTNVEFVQSLGDARLKVNVWERGAGATLACGTGACAVVVAGVRTKRSAREATVELPGGALRVRWDESSNRVFLTGPARIICEGILSAEFMEGKL